MKKESIVVAYDSYQAIAEEIADKLGAETVSVQSMNIRQIENSQFRQNGAHIVGDQLYAGTSGWNLNNWVCAVSLNL
jgi:hypothetical protein